MNIAKRQVHPKDIDNVASLLRFLVIDNRSDGRFFLSSTLFRKFPGALVHTCQDLVAGAEIARAQPPDAVVIRNQVGQEALAWVHSLRATTPAPILAMSTSGAKERMLAVGAAQFLEYDQWLLVGTAVAELLDLDAKGPIRNPS